MLVGCAVVGWAYVMVGLTSVMEATWVAEEGRFETCAGTGRAVRDGIAVPAVGH